MSGSAIVLAAAAVFSVSLAAGPAARSADVAHVEAGPDLLLSTIRANRRALIAVNLGLSEEESARFWPLYDRYQQEMNSAGDRVAAVIEEYVARFGDLPNDKAVQLVRDYLAAEADRARVRLTYLDQFALVLPGRTVARFFQIENKMDAVVRYDLAATIPVVDEDRGSAVR